MKYAFANMLNGYGVRGLDTDAKAYIDAIVAAGATVTTNQRNAINAFVKSGKTAGWWSSMKRIYLPIWSAASPNAIDIVSRASGTFLGTPTYGTSTVSFASGAYFDSGTSFSAQGLTASSGYIFVLATAWTNVVNAIVGSGVSANITGIYRSDVNNLRLRYSGFTEGSGQITATGNAGTLGIISGSRQGGDRKIYRRSNTGRSQVATLTTGNFGAPQASNVYFSAINQTDTIGGAAPSTMASTLGTFGFGLGLTDAQDSTFTAALETLWETCTGSTIPT